MSETFKVLQEKFGKLLDEYMALPDGDEKCEKLKEMDEVNKEIEKEMQNIENNL